MYFSARCVTLAVWAALTASAVASPVQAVTSEHNALEHGTKRASDPIDDEDSWCEFSEDLGTFENAEKALDRTTLGGSMNGWIRTKGREEWIVGLQRHFYADWDMGGDGARGCAVLAGTCAPGVDEGCRKAFRNSKGHYWRKEGWWILKAVKGIHTKLGMLHQKLVSGTLATGLDIPKMAEDFETSMQEDRFDSSDMLEWMQVALGFGDLAMGFAKDLNPIAGAASGLLGTVLGFANDNTAEEEEKKVSIAQVQTTLSQVFNSTEEGIERTLRAAMGMAHDSQKEDYDRLPHLTKGSGYDSPITNFYDTPFWLVNDASESMKRMLDSAIDTIRLYIVDMIIQGLGYGILWDTEVKDEKSCNGASRKWMQVAGKGRCFSLYLDNGKSALSTPGTIPKDSTIPDKMKKWGIHDLGVYYQSSIDCAKSKCDKPKKLGVGSVTNEGMPLCFFSAPVKKLESTVQNCNSQLTGCITIYKHLEFVGDESKEECPE